MRRYLLRRLLFFIPTLLVITLLTFGLTKVAPGDPVVALCEEPALTDSLTYSRCKEELGLYKPDFFNPLGPIMIILRLTCLREHFQIPQINIG